MQQRTNPRPGVGWIAGVLGATLVTMVPVRAATQTPKVYVACYVPSTGTVYRILEPGLPTACHGRHVQFSWTDLCTGCATDPNGFAVVGTLNAGTIPVEGPGVRLMWYPRKGAFRAGAPFETEWDDVEIGQFSVAMGLSTSARGFASTALGFNASASGDRSTALGERAEATGHASVAMGGRTRAAGDFATALGVETVATGNAATALGSNTIASGRASTAMGSNASTNSQDGSFVYGDLSTGSSVTASAANQFVVRAAGGTIFYSSADLSSGVQLSPGDGTWASVSDRKRKENFRDEDGEGVLAQITRLPIKSWNYKTQAPAIRHLGPTAQDFYAAFRLGGSDTTIGTVDADGVNLLAVQTLERRTAELRAASTALERRITRLEALYKRMAGSLPQAPECAERAER